MKKLVFLFLSMIGLVSAVSSQTLENSTLWKIEGNGLNSPSYLFGTIHITCDASIEDDVARALKNTDQIVMELDMDDPNMQSQMMEYMNMANDQKISKMLSEEDFAIVDGFVSKNLGVPLTMIDGLKPFMISASFYPKMLDCPMQSFEMELVKIAKEQQEEIYGLETVEEQMGLFDEISYEDQLADLLKSAKNGLSAEKETLKQLQDIYKTEDITKMLAMTNDPSNGMIAGYQDQLLINRNKNWIPKIATFAKEKSTFFAVGAAHLAGDDGVINLLRKAGYKVSAYQ